MPHNFLVMTKDSETLVETETTKLATTIVS